MPIRVLVAAHTNVGHLCHGLASHGLEVAGLQPRRVDLGEFGGLREGHQAESEFPVLAPPVFPVRPYVYSVYLTGVLRFLRDFRPHVAFLAGEPSELGMAQVARLARRAAPEVRIVFYSLENLLLDWRGFPRRLRGWALRSSLAQAHLMAAASMGVIDVLVRQGFPADRVRLLYPGVRAERFQPRDPTPVREALGLAPEAFHIGYVGRLVPEKGLDLLLKALQGLPPDCHLTIVGDGPEATSLASLASHLGLTPRVCWPGRLAHEQLAPYMSAFDVLVLPSRTLPRWAEQYGQVLVEAMLCETPVVGSTCGAIPEIIGEAGLVFPEGEVPALRETLQRLRGDRRLRQSLAAAGRARAVHGRGLLPQPDRHPAGGRGSLTSAHRRTLAASSLTSVRLGLRDTALLFAVPQVSDEPRARAPRPQGVRPRRNYMRWVAILAVMIAPVFASAGETLHGEASGLDVVLRCGAQTLNISLDNGVLNLKAHGQEVTLTPNLQLGDGWTQPQAALEGARWERTAGHLEARVTYPVAEAREFVIEATAYADLEAIFVTSRLRVLDEPRAQYYYWQSDLTSDRYYAPAPRGMAEVALNLEEWASLPWREWWFLPQGAGGLAVLPTNVAGRAPGEAGGVFLHALPRSGLLDPATSLDASFGLAWVADATAARELAVAAWRCDLPALQPGRQTQREVDYGDPAPAWLREAEVYNLCYRDKAQWTQENVREKLRGFPLIVGSTPDKAALDRCHAEGVKLLHYVVYTCLLDTELQVREGGRVYSEWSESLDNETRDLKDHPDWVCIARDGSIQHDAWGQEHGHPGLLNTCLHQPGLKAAAVRQVRMLMELGYDGVFIDLAGPTVECYGPHYGKHTHPHPGWTNTQAYEDVLRAVYAEVKRHGPDRIVMQNTCTGILPTHWAYCDSQMLEAFPYGSDSAMLRSPWPELQWHRQRWAEAVAHGKVPVILPYFGAGTSEQLLDAALLSRAYAAMAGFLWADALGLRDLPAAADFAAEVYAARLGRPTGECRQSRGATYRVFERGLAVVNPNPWPVTVAVPWPQATTLRDIGHGGTIASRHGVLRLDLAPESGRILTLP